LLRFLEFSPNFLEFGNEVGVDDCRSEMLESLTGIENGTL